MCYGSFRWEALLNAGRVFGPVSGLGPTKLGYQLWGLIPPQTTSCQAPSAAPPRFLPPLRPHGERWRFRRRRGCARVRPKLPQRLHPRERGRARPWAQCVRVVRSGRKSWTLLQGVEEVWASSCQPRRTDWAVSSVGFRWQPRWQGAGNRIAQFCLNSYFRRVIRVVGCKGAW